MAINEQWNIKSRAHACFVTETAFTEGDAFITALYHTKTGELERRDYSITAWQARSADAETPFSHWRSVYVPPVREKKEDPMHRENAEEMLRRLIEEDAEHTENVRFILAIMLERKKLLRETDRQTIGATALLVYEHRKTGEVFIVRNPQIPLSEVDQVQEEVVALLAGEEEQSEASDTESDTEPESGSGSPKPHNS